MGEANAVAHRECLSCKAPFVPQNRRGPASTFCSPDCRYHVNHPRVERRCTTCNTTFTATSKRMYCSPACYRKRPTQHIRTLCNCSRCGQQFDKFHRSLNTLCATCLVTKRQETMRSSVAGQMLLCPSCGRQSPRRRAAQTYCSRACGNRAATRKKKAVHRRAFVEVVTLAVLFHRDGGVCQICALPVDLNICGTESMAPSIDHRVPLSRGGEHSYANTQLAHFGCNSRKGDRIAGEVG